MPCKAVLVSPLQCSLIKPASPTISRYNVLRGLMMMTRKPDFHSFHWLNLDVGRDRFFRNTELERATRCEPAGEDGRQKPKLITGIDMRDQKFSSRVSGENVFAGIWRGTS